MLAKQWVDIMFCVQRISDRILVLKLIFDKQIFTFVALYTPKPTSLCTTRTVFMTICRVLSWMFQPLRYYSSLRVGLAMSTLLRMSMAATVTASKIKKVQESSIFALANDLVLGNTLFLKKESHLVTLSSGGKRTQIDYVL